MGLGDTLDRGDSMATVGENLPFVPFDPLTGVDRVALSQDFMCAAIGDTYRCWGNNKFGQLGQGDTMLRGGDENSTPLLLTPIPGLVPKLAR